MPINEYKTREESIEDYKKRHYSIIKACEEYDILIKNVREELADIREERKLKYL